MSICIGEIQELSCHELTTIEFFLNYLGRSPDLSEPVLANVTINEIRTRTLAWYGLPPLERSDYDQELFFFPVIRPVFSEWEYMGPAEWIVSFVGTAVGLRESRLAGVYPEVVDSIRDTTPFALLRTKAFMRGLSHEEIWQNFYRVDLVQRVEHGTLIRPASYIERDL